MEFGLKEETLRKIRQTLAGYEEVEEAVLYGSRAKGNHRPGSDIDLSLRGDRLSLQTLNRIESDLDDLLLPCRFDLSLYAQIANRDLLEHIERFGRRIYRREAQ